MIPLYLSRSIKEVGKHNYFAIGIFCPPNSYNEGAYRLYPNFVLTIVDLTPKDKRQLALPRIDFILDLWSDNKYFTFVHT